MDQIKFVIPFLLSSLFSEEKTRVEWLTFMIHAQGSVLDRGLGGER
jgi:hypothetical protein